MSLSYSCRIKRQPGHSSAKADLGSQIDQCSLMVECACFPATQLEFHSGKHHIPGILLNFKLLWKFVYLYYIYGKCPLVYIKFSRDPGQSH